MKKYAHPITSSLTPDNWQDKINLNALSLEDLVEIFGDMKAMENFGKKLSGYLKEVIKARMPEGEDEFDSTHFHIQRNFRTRAGGLDGAKILEDMGEEWVEDHSQDSTDYVELRCTRLEDG